MRCIDKKMYIKLTDSSEKAQANTHLSLIHFNTTNYTKLSKYADRIKR